MTEDVATTGREKPLTIGMLIYPNFTLLDLAGPQAVLGMHAETLLLWKSRNPVMTDAGIAMHPTTTFDECPDALDVLFVPGGLGTNAAMQDEAVVAFLSRAGRSARYVTSVCTGSLLLAMAGLLDGRRAATHWAFYDALAASGAIAVHERVVVDGNRFSGGGVTAGIDFGLRLLQELRDERVAKTTQLIIEYDPEPPFQAGTPEQAGSEIVGEAMKMLDNASSEIVQTLKAGRVSSRRAASVEDDAALTHADEAEILV